MAPPCGDDKKKASNRFLSQRFFARQKEAGDCFLYGRDGSFAQKNTVARFLY
jgi:hypothetical protein